MAKNNQPVLKRARTLGIEPGFVGVYKTSKRVPKQSRKKQSNYGLQLKEKQKVKFIYGILEKQLRNTFAKAEKKSGNVGENLLMLLEQRMDNAVYRLGLATTRREAKQLVSHAHFTVNGKKMNIPSALVKPGDVIAVREKSQQSPKFKEIAEGLKGKAVPSWLELDAANMAGKVVALPARSDVDAPIDEQLIVEFYSR
ncbi:MAG: 30S ribosomal protein S4 [Firmicutes bacterium]|nr:30S ribosomal protein S4 [Bacillota bacterium]